MSSGQGAALDPAIEALIQALPKAELHVHLEGSIPPALASQLAARYGMSLPGIENAGDGSGRRYRFTSFQAFIDLYVALSRCLRVSEDFADVVVAVAGELSRQNVRYAEITFTPMTHVARGVAVDAILGGLARGRARALDEHGVEIGWVFDIVRIFPDQAMPTLDLALQAADAGVVGLGLAGPEARPHDVGAFVPVFERARALGLSSLPHAGEMGGPENVWDAVERLGARRIGHGIRCLEDDALVERLREAAIPLEVCPSSNVALGVVDSLETHPLPRLLAAGLRVSLASDDPPLFGTTLVDEYRRCAACFEWDAERIVELAVAAVEDACLPADRKKQLILEQRRVASGV